MLPVQSLQSMRFLWAFVSPQYPDLEHQQLQLPALSTLCCADLHLQEEGQEAKIESFVPIFKKTRINTVQSKAKTRLLHSAN